MSGVDVIQAIDNKWHKAYWFARYLINNDKYGGIGKDSNLISTLASALRVVAANNVGKGIVLELQKQTMRNLLVERFKNAEAIRRRVELLLLDLDDKIKDEGDMQVFILTCDHIMLPINQAIANIPSDDKEFTEAIAKTYLDIQGESGLAKVIKIWDDLGVEGCLTAERTEIVKAFSIMRLVLDKINDVNDEVKDIVLSAFVQEFERRAGQKRKGRAGGSLEDVTDFILNYYKIPSAPKPEHFQADLEIDNFVRTHDGWMIGISCKRTLRERWKQVSSADRGILSKFKIKQVWHVITYDEDLSDEKLGLLGSLSHIVYLPDDSRRLQKAQQNVGLKEFVRPMSNFIHDLKIEAEGPN